ncbi:synaptobrevin, longin-like domain protein, partial [Tanacetum coccineum]
MLRAQECTTGIWSSGLHTSGFIVGDFARTTAGRPPRKGSLDGILQDRAQICAGDEGIVDSGDEGIVDSGCSRSMIGNKERLDDFQSFKGGKDGTYPKSFKAHYFTSVENQLNKKVKAIRCNNGTEFKNAKLIELCREKVIKRDYSNARTPRQNGVAERKNITLIEAARTMLADSKLPTMFWTEVVSTACYVLNRVLITNPHNKTPYALLTGKTLSISHFKPFSNRAYMVYNMANKRVEEIMNLRFLEEKANIQGIGHEWSFDLDYLTDSLGYNCDKANQSAGPLLSFNTLGAETKDWIGGLQMMLRNFEEEKVQNQFLLVASIPSGSPTDYSLIIEPTTDCSPSYLEIMTSLVFLFFIYDDECGAESKQFSINMEVRGPVETQAKSIQFSSIFIFMTSRGGNNLQTFQQWRNATVHIKCMGFVDLPEALSRRYMLLNLRDLWILNIQEGLQEEAPLTRLSFLRNIKEISSWYMFMGDDIIFGSTKKQRPDGIFIGQDKYVQEILKKFDLESVRTATTPYEAPKPNHFLDISNLEAVREEDLSSILKAPKWGYGTLGVTFWCLTLIVTSVYAKATRIGNPQLVDVSFWVGDSLIQISCLIIGSDDYHQILDFLRASHIRSPELGPPAILATIDETPYTITEDSVRSQLQLADDGGIDDLPIAEIYSGMDNLGWDQFGISLAIALICLSDGRRFNWSSYIFKGMVSNIGNAKKFLMYPRFLQTILGIETRITRQYHVFKLSSKLFANMKLNFEGQPMQLLAAMLPQDQDGEGAGVAAQAVPPPIPKPIPEPMPEPDQSQDHLSTTLRPPTSDPFSSTNVEDKPLRVSTLVQKVTSLETELKAHKQLFKDVVGKLVKKVKAMEVKLKPKKRKVVVSDFDQEEGGEQAVDLDALIALANAAVTVDSNIPPGGPSNDPAASSHIPIDVPTDGDFAHAH